MMPDDYRGQLKQILRDKERILKKIRVYQDMLDRLCNDEIIDDLKLEIIYDEGLLGEAPWEVIVHSTSGNESLFSFRSSSSEHPKLNELFGDEITVIHDKEFSIEHDVNFYYIRLSSKTNPKEFAKKWQIELDIETLYEPNPCLTEKELEEVNDLIKSVEDNKVNNQDK